MLLYINENEPKRNTLVVWNLKKKLSSVFSDLKTEELESIISEYEELGYISMVPDGEDVGLVFKNNSLEEISVFLSIKGKEFLSSGGFTKKHKQEKRKRQLFWIKEIIIIIFSTLGIIAFFRTL